MTNKKILDGRNCITFPSVKKGSGLDNLGDRKNITPIKIEEQKKVKSPTVVKIIRVDKTDDPSDMTG